MRFVAVALLLLLLGLGAATVPEMPCPAPSVYNPNTPMQLCSNLPWRFLDCVPAGAEADAQDEEEVLRGDAAVDANTSSASSSSLGVQGCGDDGRGTVQCRALEGVACFGPRVFLAQDTTGRWCEAERRARLGTKRFSTAFAASLAAGWLGADRIYLGYVGIGILKLLTLGGVGVWWLIDLFLLSTGTLGPADNVPWDAQG